MSLNERLPLLELVVLPLIECNNLDIALAKGIYLCGFDGVGTVTNNVRIIRFIGLTKRILVQSNVISIQLKYSQIT